MTKGNKAGNPAVAGNGKKGSSARIAVAGLAMLMTFWVGTARNSVARRPPRDSRCRFEDVGARL